MNVFVIPSWYPSKGNASYGIFIEEQIEMLAMARPDWKIGVSTWGQGDSQKQLWIKDHLKNISKIRAHRRDKPSKNQNKNISTYYHPALSWTKKIKKGNHKEINRCNDLNYQAHVDAHGKPDIVWVQASYPGALMGNYLLNKYEMRYVTHVRLGGFMFEHLLKEVGSMKKKLLEAISYSKIVTVTSTFQMQDLESWIPKCKVLNNPVDTDYFLHEVADGATSIVAIGRLEKEKGFDLLLEALAMIEDLPLRIGGAGTQKGALEAQAKRLGIAQRVTFLGELDREMVRSEIQSSMFLVMPSRYETFGNVLLEAKACGKPVVTTRCGGPEELVSSECGYVADAEVKDLSEKIKLMTNNKNLFDPIEIRKRAVREHSIDRWANQLEHHLTAAASRKF